MTDANLVLGYLDPGELPRRRARARSRRRPSARSIAIAARARHRPASPRREGIHRVVNTNMAEGIRLVSVRRGVDPRRFALLAFGGAAGLHVTDVARQLDLARVVVPRVAAVLSAWGMLATDLRFEVSRTHIGDAGALDGAAVKRLFAEMEAEGLRAAARLVRRAGRAPRARSTCATASRSSRSPCRSTTSTGAAADPLPQIVERFHRRHEALYTYSLPDQEAVLVNARVAVSGILENCRTSRACRRRRPPRPRAERRIYLDGLGDGAGLPLRRARAGAGDRRPGDRRIRR